MSNILYKTSLIIFICLIYNMLYTQDFCLEIPSNTKANAAIIDDSSYVVIGNGNNSVVKVSSNASILWSNKYIISGSYGNPVDIIKSKDGNYIILGSNGNSSFEVYKIDPDGNPIWIKKYTFLNAIKILELSDESLIVVGEHSYQRLIVKLNKTGDLLWSKKYASSGMNYVYSAIPNIDGLSFSLISYTEWGNSQIEKFDSSGSKIIIRSLEGISPAGYQLLATKDGGFVYSVLNYLGKLDSNLAIQWEKEITNFPSYPQIHLQSAMIERENNDLVFGYTFNNNISILASFDPYGNFKYGMKMDGFVLNDMKPTMDNGLVAVGISSGVMSIRKFNEELLICCNHQSLSFNVINDSFTYGSTSSYYPAYVNNTHVQSIPTVTPTTNNSYNLICSNSIILRQAEPTEKALNIFPNPAENKLNVAYKKDRYEVKIFDLTGRVTKHQVISNYNGEIDISNLTEGIYFIQVDGSTSKFIKQ